ncbi:MAG: type II toxin-antitoxin system HicA family toxin [Burkholderiales bacterium]
MSGADLARAMTRLGYRISRQSGSHIRMSLDSEPQHHLTIPAHAVLKTGTLAAILSMTADRLNLSRDELLSALKL